MSLNTRKPLPEIEAELIKFGIDNYITTGDIRLFYRLASALPPGSQILEIGTNRGRSTRIFAMAAPDCNIVTVDKFDLWDNSLSQPENIRRLIMDSSEVAGRLLGGYDLIFIDGDHLRDGVLSDINNCIPLLSEKGIVIFHDYTGSWPGVAEAVNLYLSTGVEFERIETVEDEKDTVCFAMRRPQ